MPIQVEQIAGARRSLRIAVVTETYPPEVNGVSLTIARFVEGLRRRGHDIQLVRPRQDGADRRRGGGRLPGSPDARHVDSRATRA